MYKGQIKDFPKEVVEKMLERQIEQGSKRDITVFESLKSMPRYYNGFNWDETIEGEFFWREVINCNNFDLFFQRYPKNDYSKNDYPKIMMVSDHPITEKNEGVKRIVFMEKNGRYLAWVNATTFEEAERNVTTIHWKYAKDIESSDIVELTFEDISKGKGVGIDPKLIRIKEK